MKTSIAHLVFLIIFEFFFKLIIMDERLFNKYPCLPSVTFISFNLNLNINNFPYNSCMIPSVTFISFNLNLNINNFPYNSCMTLGTSSTSPCNDSSKSDTDVFRSFLALSSNMVHVVLAV
jgi:hypothetical protein